MSLSRHLRVLLFSLAAWVLTGCGSEQESTTTASGDVSDSQLQSMVEAAVANASDLPEGLSIQVSDGVVSVTGSLDCPDCGGQRTPGTLGTIQQSLGAVIRAVPGVRDVRFMFIVSTQ